MKNLNPNHIFWELATKVLACEASEKEKESLNGLMENDKQLVQLYNSLQQLFKESKNLAPFDAINPHEDWQALQLKIQERKNAESSHQQARKNKLNIQQYIPYAAAVVIFVIMGSLLLLQQSKQPLSGDTFTTIEAPRGSKVRITLPDSSAIWLNAGSSIKYNNQFNQSQRAIALIGEAFFDVAKSDIPFIVNALDIHIQVLGTSFNVQAYPDEDLIETTLVSGSLKIMGESIDGSSSQDLILKPRQKAVFHKKEATIALLEEKQSNSQDSLLDKRPIPQKVEIIQVANLEPEISWKDGVLTMENERLSSLTRKLERRYDVNFIFENDQLKDMRYSGKLPTLTLEQVLFAMQLTSPLKYKLEEKSVFLSFDKEKAEQFNYLLNN